jgi:asparagine synthase (glutamine-hydrolysing)
MGGFFLARRDDLVDLKRTQDRLCKAFADQGFDTPKIISTLHADIYLYRKLNVPVWQLFYGDSQNFALFTGTALYRGRSGIAAATALFEQFSFDSPDWGEFSGDFCALVARDSALRLFIDPLGIYKVYRDHNGAVFSTSFLAVLETVESPSINSQAVYEYVFQGATYGDKTVIEQVELVSSGGAYQLDRKLLFRAWPEHLSPRFKQASFEAHVRKNLANLQRVFWPLKSCFGNNVSTALTGGYDSRLALALLWEQGVRPRNVHVYGSEHNTDVKIARQIAERESFALIHVDKARYPTVNRDTFSEAVARNFHFFDGCPVDGIFDNGVDLQTRLDRCTKGELHLNAGGGEIFRNFFNLRDSRFSVQQFLWSFYNRYDPRTCTDFFSERAYLAALGEKIKAALSHTDSILQREEIELLYVIFRCRYWMGKNNSINNRFSWTLTPFINWRVVKDAVSIPPAYKKHGRLEAALIQAINQTLAQYPSVYGHNFAEEPPLARILSDYSTILRPPFLRRYTYRIRNRWAHRPAARSYYLSDNYLCTVVDIAFPYMSAFFHVDKLAESRAFNRCCTLEYLFERYNVGNGRRLT